MLSRFFGSRFHDYFHFFGTIVLLAGLPMSKALMSIGTMLLALNFLLEGNYLQKIRTLRSQKSFLWLFLLVLLHFAGLLWTEDFGYASNDLRIKLPLLALPIIFASRKPFTPIEFRSLFLIYIAILLTTSFYNFASYQHWIGNRTYDDIRGLSLFGSHIRYGIQIAFAAGLSLHLFVSERSAWRYFLIPIFIWFSYYTFFSQILSGLIALAVVIALALMIPAYRSGKKYLLALSVLILLTIPATLTYLLIPPSMQQLDETKLEEKTSKGNPYTHDLREELYYNGKPIFIYVCEKELQEEWGKRSEIPYMGLDRKGQPMRYTLIRYLASRDLRKDAVGVSKLSEEEITSIENGTASILEKGNGLSARLEGIRYEIHYPHDPNGHSILQRIEFWKTGWQIIEQHWLFGVGTGDLQTAFDRQYAKNLTKLEKKNRLRAHNSYLTYWISFGIAGIVSFILMQIVFFSEQLRRGFYPGMAFILISASTFLIEDTLETQMGVTFFAFFFGMFSNQDRRVISS